MGLETGRDSSSRKLIEKAQTMALDLCWFPVCKGVALQIVHFHNRDLWLPLNR